MYKTFYLQSISIGLAMFSMFFGAGNIIFPLALGQIAGDKNLYAMGGLILSAALMPIIGVMAMILFEGNYREFFGRLGRVPGFTLALITISLLGPLGSTPRCIALSYTTLSSIFPEMSSLLFSLGSCILILLLSYNKSHILSILGWVLTPFLLGSLILIILFGMIYSPEMTQVHESNTEMFLYGLKEGYNTMDLLAAFFFSSTILHVLRLQNKDKENGEGNKSYLRIAYQASIIGAILLSLIYIGFSYLAAFHGADFMHIGKDELLAAITMKIAGPYGGILVCLTIAMACLTTAIALISSFSDFIQKEVFNDSVDYKFILICSLILTFFISTFNFTGISVFLTPILEICYPGLIMLTLVNIAYKLYGFQSVKIPVFGTFLISTIFYFNSFAI